MVCGKRFSYLSRFKLHETSHSPQKPWTCQLCLKNFKRKDHLVAHLRYFHMESIPKLKTSREEVAESERYGNQCERCGNYYSCWRNLQRHIQEFHMRIRKIYICKLCGNKYLSTASRNNHMKATHTKLWKRCRYCSHTVKYQTSLRKHIQTKHPDVDK